MINLRELQEENPNISKETIDRRNDLLARMFYRVFNKNEIMVIGDPNKPSVIRMPKLSEAFAISCYVHNFTLIFLDKPFKGNQTYSFTLTEKSVENPPVTEILQAIQNARHRSVYQIREKNSGLRLCGYNFVDSNSEETKYPVFAMHKPKIYFNLDHADQLIQQLKGYDLEIVN